MIDNRNKDFFTKIEWFIFRLTFVLLMLFEVSKFFKHLIEHW